MQTDFDDFHISRRINTWIGPDGCDSDYEGSHPDLNDHPKPDPEKAWKRFSEQWEKWCKLTPLTLGIKE